MRVGDLDDSFVDIVELQSKCSGHRRVHGVGAGDVGELEEKVTKQLKALVELVNRVNEENAEIEMSVLLHTEDVVRGKPVLFLKDLKNDVEISKDLWVTTVDATIIDEDDIGCIKVWDATECEYDSQYFDLTDSGYAGARGVKGFLEFIALDLAYELGRIQHNRALQAILDQQVLNGQS